MFTGEAFGISNNGTLKLDMNAINKSNEDHDEESEVLLLSKVFKQTFDDSPRQYSKFKKPLQNP